MRGPSSTYSSLCDCDLCGIQTKPHRLKSVLENYGDRERSRARIRSSTSGFTRIGPHCGPCPTTNSRATTRDLSRSREAFSENRGRLSGPAIAAPAAAERAGWFKAGCDAGVFACSGRCISDFEFRFGRQGCWLDVIPTAAVSCEVYCFPSPRTLALTPSSSCFLFHFQSCP
jgi:hypothetical protein